MGGKDKTSMSICLSVSVALYLSRSLSRSLCPCLSVCLCLSVSGSPFLFISILSISMCPSFYLFVPLSLSTFSVVSLPPSSLALLTSHPVCFRLFLTSYLILLKSLMVLLAASFLFNQRYSAELSICKPSMP